MLAAGVPIGLPADALVVLVGPAGAGKSTWAAAHFAAHEILSSDHLRWMVSGDASDQSANADAFKLLHTVVRARLRRELPTVVDATNLTLEARRALLRLARSAGRPAVAIVFDVPLERCIARSAARRERVVPEEVVRRQHAELRAAVGRIGREGFHAIHVLEEADLPAASDSRPEPPRPTR